MSPLCACPLRVSAKSCKPHLTEKQTSDRLHYATKNKTNKFKAWVDIDEKWFYVYSHSGKLKLPPGIEREAPHACQVEAVHWQGDDAARDCKA